MGLPMSSPRVDAKKLRPKFGVKVWDEDELM
jgi:hypothetical protein